MRLVHTQTFKVEQFPDERNLKYAILSHRWQEGEVTLNDVESGSAPEKSGYKKFQRSCHKAREDGYDYIWVDTCCIDKTSSAELSEAINSMYRWYRLSGRCYVFLYDVTQSTPIESTSGSFHKSVWFTRGWTLQELIAPQSVEFYNCYWQKLGTKHDLSLDISNITGISVPVLSGETPIDHFSVAQRMSWAAKRETTRVEDTAYSLMGLFGIYMPMFYGEGQKAFRRLQEEIMKTHDDATIFAWDMLDDGYRGPFAESPAEFSSGGSIMVATEEWQNEPPLVSSKGVSVKLPMMAWSLEVYLVALDCWDSRRYEYSPDIARIGIFLSLLPQHQRYARVRVNGSDKMIFPEGWKNESKVIQGFIVESPGNNPPPLERLYGFLD